MKKYKIIEGNYDDFVKYNGLKHKNKPAALEIRDNVAKYLMIFDGEELYSDVIIFDEKEVLINLNITFMVSEYLDDLLEYLKDPTWEKFGEIISDIGLIILGVGIIIGGVPAIIAGVIAIISLLFSISFSK